MRNLRSQLLWRWATLKIGFRDATAYRVEFFIEIIGSALVPVSIQWVFWYALFNLGAAQEVAGLTYTQMLQYTFTSILFSQIRGGNHDFELAELIRNGQLSNYLLRPLGVVEFIWVRGIAEKLFIALLALCAGCIASHWLGVSIPSLFAAMFLALLGNIIHYQIGAALAATAFAWEESYSLLMIKNVLVGILSGEVLPLTLIPAQYSWVWKSTPFYLYVFGPTQMALGHWSTLQYFENLLIATLWLLFGWALVKASWAFGMKRYLSLGG